MTKHYNGPKKKRPGFLLWAVSYLTTCRGDETEAWLISSYFRWYPFDDYGAA